MTKAGFNPVRRNRNIGTAKQGHGQSNKLVIPAICSGERAWTQTLHAHAVILRRIRSRDITFIIEKCRSGYTHACSVEDISHILTHVPVEDWRGIDTIVLRQSTRKQWLLRPAWGRIYYSANLALAGQKTLRTGPTIALEAVNCDDAIKWQTSLQPSDRAELERLRGDGHDIKQRGRHYTISLSLGSVRACQLYRTLLHEIGHWVDFEKSTRPLTREGNSDSLERVDQYFARPTSQREAFAHQYAISIQAFMEKFGIIPFDALQGDRIP